MMLVYTKSDSWNGKNRDKMKTGKVKTEKIVYIIKK